MNHRNGDFASLSTVASPSVNTSPKLLVDFKKEDTTGQILILNQYAETVLIGGDNTVATSGYPLAEGESVELFIRDAFQLWGYCAGGFARLRIAQGTFEERNKLAQLKDTTSPTLLSLATAKITVNTTTPTQLRTDLFGNKQLFIKNNGGHFAYIGGADLEQSGDKQGIRIEDGEELIIENNAGNTVYGMAGTGAAGNDLDLNILEAKSY